MKVYSRNNLNFCISPYPKKADKTTVFFTGQEYDYIKSKHMTEKEFQFCHQSKLEDHTWSPIPPVKMHIDKERAINHSKQIIDSLKRKLPTPPTHDEPQTSDAESTNDPCQFEDIVI